MLTTELPPFPSSSSSPSTTSQDVRRDTARRLHVGLDLRVQVDALRVDLQESVGPIQQSQLAGLVLLLGLLSPEGHLGRHHPLPLGDEGALGAQTVPPPAVALVALEGRHHPVVAAPGALRGAGVAVVSSQEHGRAVVRRASVVLRAAHCWGGGHSVLSASRRQDWRGLVVGPGTTSHSQVSTGHFFNNCCKLCGASPNVSSN